MEVAIVNGWQLSSVKDNSDNTAWLTLLTKAAGLGLDGGSDCAEGTYRLNRTGKLEPYHLFQSAGTK